MELSEGAHSELLQNMAEEEDGGDEEEYLANQFPDWQLIDEISVRLLEQGIGTFETLQRALPSVALAQIEQIQENSNESNIEEAKNKKCCSAGRMLKLFRLAQLQIDYLLKSQQEMVQKVAKAEERAKRLKKENKALREQFCRGPKGEKDGGEGPMVEEGPQWGRELFRCNECTKIFLHANFLAEHIQRRHGGNLEGAARLSSMKNKAGRVLGLGDRGDQTEQASTSTTSAAMKGNNTNERNRTMKRKGAPQRGQSQGSGTFRKRTEGGGGGRSATEVLKPRQQSQGNQQKYWQDPPEQKSSCPSSSIGEDIAMAALAETSGAGKEQRRTTWTMLSGGEEGERG